MTRRVGRRLLVASLAVFITVVLATLIPPPRPVVRFLAVSSAPSLMTPDDNDGRVVGAAKRIWRGYIQNALSAHFANDVIVETRSDVDALADVMNAARALVLAPTDDARYDVSRMPAVVAGVGYCDQINAFVASAAAHRFDKAELFALYEKGRVAAPHSVGRVWSAQRNEWLYFDAFYARPVIFTKNARGKARFLPIDKGRMLASRPAVPHGTYDLPGWPLSEFPATFAMFLLARSQGSHSAGDVVREREPAPEVAHSVQPAVASSDAATQAGAKNVANPARKSVSDADAEGAAKSAAGMELKAVAGVLEKVPELDPKLAAPAPNRITRRSDEVYRRVARAYVSARVDHLLNAGDVSAYRAIAADPEATRDDRAAELASTAERFANGHHADR